MLLNEVNIVQASIPVISNVTANQLDEPNEIKEKLIEQLYSPVLWEDSVKTLLALGVDTFVEVGPGKVLSGLMKKVDRSAKLYNVSDLESLAKTIGSLKGGDNNALQGKKVLVTGASRGIGREIALEFARLGADVAVNYAGSEAKANEVVAEIKALGQDAIAIQCDVANSDQVSDMVKARLTILVI